jgi:hypothetical protein
MGAQPFTTAKSVRMALGEVRFSYTQLGASVVTLHDNLKPSGVRPTTLGGRRKVEAGHGVQVPADRPSFIPEDSSTMVGQGSRSLRAALISGNEK